MADALGILELSSIARGIATSDAMVKRAPIRILKTHPISPGHHLVVVEGGVAEVEESFHAGRDLADDALIDDLYLPQAHKSLAPLLAGRPASQKPNDAIGIVETRTVCAAVLAADAAAKAAPIALLDLRLGQGLGGKAFFTLTGDLSDVEAAVGAAADILAPHKLLATEIIPAPHSDLHAGLLRGSP